MTYKLKQVQNTDEIEKCMRRNVSQQLNKPKRKKIIHIPILTAIITIATIFLVMQLMSPNSSMKTASPALMNVFTEIDGNGIVYSQDYYELDMQHIRTLKYYREVPLATFLQVNHVELTQLPAPFSIEDGTVIAVNDGYLTELQLHFKKDDAFINISMAKSYGSQIEYATFAEIKQDAYGTPIELERLNPSTTMAKKFIQGDGGLVYHYYHYNEKNDEVNVTATIANEIYSIEDSFIYHLGFSQNSSLTKEQMTDFAKEFILNNELKTLNFEEVTYVSTWLTRGGKAMLVCLVVAVMSFVLFVPLLRERSPKVQKIIWSLIWIFLHAPILTWLISFSVGTLYRDGFAAVGMLFIAYPALFVVGILIIWLVKSRVRWIVVLHVLAFIFTVSVSIWNGYYIESEQVSHEVKAEQKIS
ncbi:MAG: hypothetical protein ABS942_08260 [Solibacillus sp.]